MKDQAQSAAIIDEKKTEKVKVIFMTGREAADYLRIGKSTLYQMAKEGKVPYVMIGARMRFRSDELDGTFRSNPA